MSEYLGVPRCAPTRTENVNLLVQKRLGQQRESTLLGIFSLQSDAYWSWWLP